jgi:hypothetical protein
MFILTQQYNMYVPVILQFARIISGYRPPFNQKASGSEWIRCILEIDLLELRFSFTHLSSTIHHVEIAQNSLTAMLVYGSDRWEAISCISSVFHWAEGYRGDKV